MLYYFYLCNQVSIIHLFLAVLCICVCLSKSLSGHLTYFTSSILIIFFMNPLNMTSYVICGWVQWILASPLIIASFSCSIFSLSTLSILYLELFLKYTTIPTSLFSLGLVFFFLSRASSLPIPPHTVFSWWFGWHWRSSSRLFGCS